ncbi:alpha-(1,3)-fucosyltransferase C-like [Cydia pomonella]|uniref:alpha-(1,3)-fucosyltransferase C-like n=1 Tax=Cydia pomonella TaxID=82600 RepID=UPI002ADDC1EA|nr:alpha-(1,3)-fucosyltransferase C-like [Cydia pomonella]
MYSYQVKELSFSNEKKRTWIKYAIAITLLCCVLASTFVPNFLLHYASSNKYLPQHHRFASDLKHVLIWTTSEDHSYFDHNEGQKDFVRQQCPIFNCYISYNKSLLRGDVRNYDAVVVDIREVLKSYMIQPYPIFQRSPHQIYVFHALEPSTKYSICNPNLDHFFNWTWSYKLNSDIPHPFFNIHNLKREIIGPKINITWLDKLKHDSRNKDLIKRKTKSVAWLLTECTSKVLHEKFVNQFQAELANYNYTLDVYGACGHQSCSEKGKFKCYKMIEKNYFFSLVTEEINCEDWVTDKIINTLNHISIPIVVGRANYSSFLPPGSYIDAKAHTMKELVGIMNYLMTYPDTYSFFFDWKNHYYYTPRPKSYLCDLCSRLNDNNKPQSLGDLRKWWNPNYNKRCAAMNDPFLESDYDQL